MSRKPDVRFFLDPLTNATKSLDFQHVIRDRNYFLIDGVETLTFPTASANTQYLENTLSITSADSLSVSFPFTFINRPFLAFQVRPEGSGSILANVAYWISDFTNNGFTANFSAPFDGEIKYRAVYTDGAYPVRVERTPGNFAWIAGAEISCNQQSNVTMSFGAFPSLPTEVFSNPIGTSTDATLNLGQSYFDLGLDYVEIELSEPYTGFVDVVAMVTDPPTSVQPIDPI